MDQAVFFYLVDKIPNYVLVQPDITGYSIRAVVISAGHELVVLR